MVLLVKFICSEKATVGLSYVVQVKSRAEISQNFVTFSEYMKASAVTKFPVKLTQVKKCLAYYFK